MISQKPFSLTMRVEGDIHLLDLHDVLIFGQAHLLKEKVQSLVQDEQARLFLLNLSQVSFIDSSGLGALISIKKIIESVTGRLALVGLQPRVRHTFELVSFDRAFVIEADEAAAIARLTQP